ncbi:metalloregulator ArsR/SmtB family transcription factor [Erythrobacter alti]|uniref:ArsR/SmtB family transcription factor n=1 Tax=Erythrobacter alti TaxID=1896145 RepID=UPI0030F38F47
MTDVLIDQFKAIAHPLRYRILQALTAGERNVGEIEAAAGIGQPALSQQLGVLRKADLVETRKEAKLVYYRLAHEQFARLSQEIGAFAPKELEAGDRPARSDGAANFARIY